MRPPHETPGRGGARTPTIACRTAHRITLSTAAAAASTSPNNPHICFGYWCLGWGSDPGLEQPTASSSHTNDETGFLLVSSWCHHDEAGFICVCTPRVESAHSPLSTAHTTPSGCQPTTTPRSSSDLEAQLPRSLTARCGACTP